MTEEQSFLTPEELEQVRKGWAIEAGDLMQRDGTDPRTQRSGYSILVLIPSSVPNVKL